MMIFPKSREELDASIKKARRRKINNYLLIRAMKAIEGLTSEDVCMSPENKLSEIYSMAHASLNHCNNNHDDWKKQIIVTHKAMVKIGVSES